MNMNNEDLYSILLSSAEIHLIHSMIERELELEELLEQYEQEALRIISDALDDGYRAGGGFDD